MSSKGSTYYLIWSVIIIELLFKIFVYGFLILSFLFLPLIIGLIYKFTLEKRLKVKSVLVVFLIIFIQLILLVIVYFNPIVTYSNDISDEIINENAEWAVEILEKPWKGFYSQNIPIIAYKFKILELSDLHVVADVYYLPFGNMKVQWNEFYDIIEPLEQF